MQSLDGTGEHEAMARVQIAVGEYSLRCADCARQKTPSFEAEQQVYCTGEECRCPSI